MKKRHNGPIDMRAKDALNMKTAEIVGFRARIHEKITAMDHFADGLTEFFGSIWFFVGNAIIFLVWIIFNAGIFSHVQPFDPFPFNFLTMTVSLEAIFLAVIVLMSQNRAAKIADLREEVDFEINLRAEAEITRILTMLDEIHDHLGLDPVDDPELVHMKERTDVEAIERVIQEENER